MSSGDLEKFWILWHDDSPGNPFLILFASPKAEGGPRRKEDLRTGISVFQREGLEVFRG